jgi:hypothetical protein
MRFSLSHGMVSGLPSVVPPGQFAIAHSLKNTETFILPAGHFRFDGDDEIYEKLKEKKLALFL